MQVVAGGRRHPVSAASRHSGGHRAAALHTLAHKGARPLVVVHNLLQRGRGHQLGAVRVAARLHHAHDVQVAQALLRVWGVGRVVGGWGAGGLGGQAAPSPRTRLRVAPAAQPSARSVRSALTSRNISTACSLAALITPVIVPPARPEA